MKTIDEKEYNLLIDFLKERKEVLKTVNDKIDNPEYIKEKFTTIPACLGCEEFENNDCNGIYHIHHDIGRYTVNFKEKRLEEDYMIYYEGESIFDSYFYFDNITHKEIKTLIKNYKKNN